MLFVPCISGFSNVLNCNEHNTSDNLASSTIQNIAMLLLAEEGSDLKHLSFRVQLICVLC